MLLLKSQDVPDWLRVPYIQSGYIYPNLTFKQCFKLMFMWHNQTINAWTMILASTVSFFLYSYYGHNVIFLLFMLSCIIHTPFAVANHILRHMNRETYALCKKMDVTLILTSSCMLTFTLSFYVFHIYITYLLTFLSISMMIYTCLYTDSKIYGLGTNVNKWKHTTILLTNILLYLSPVFYYCNDSWEAKGVLLSALATMISYLSGFPERYYPERFDILGASHQFFHIFVLSAHVFEFMFLYKVSKRI